MRSRPKGAPAVNVVFGSKLKPCQAWSLMRGSGECAPNDISAPVNSRPTRVYKDCHSFTAERRSGGRDTAFNSSPAIRANRWKPCRLAGDRARVMQHSVRTAMHGRPRP